MYEPSSENLKRLKDRLRFRPRSSKICCVRLRTRRTRRERPKPEHNLCKSNWKHPLSESPRLSAYWSSGKRTFALSEKSYLAVLKAMQTEEWRSFVTA